MPKAHRAVLKVLSAEIKQDKDHPLKAEPFCRIEYSHYMFETHQQTDPESKKPQWKDQFEITYLEKGAMSFKLLVPDKEKPAEICHGDLDLGKKLGANGEVEIALKAADGKKDKSAGVLKVSLQWLGDFDLVPFRLELVPHTVEVVKRQDLGQCKLKVGLSHKDIQESEFKEADEKGKFLFKYRTKWIITVQEEVKIQLIGKKTGTGPFLTLSMAQLKDAKPGVVRKFFLMQPTTVPEGEKAPNPPVLEKRGVIWLMINHNFRPKIDPKDGGLGLEMSDVSMSPKQRKEVGKPMGKLETRHWVYDEFKPKKKQKINLSKLNDRQKEAYWTSQEAALTKLRSHYQNLRDHLETLEDKLDDTLAKMKDKEKVDNKVKKQERRRKAEIDEKFKEIRTLQHQAEKLKEEFTGGSGFDKLKELENTKELKAKKVTELTKQIAALKVNTEGRERRAIEIEQKNKEEVNKHNSE